MVTRLGITLSGSKNPEVEVKMGFSCWGIFWGVFFILLGLSVILKAVFHIDIPLIRILFALFLIYMGIRMLVGWKGCCPWNRAEKGTVMFGEAEIKHAPGEREHNVLFGKAIVDLTQLTVKDQDIPVEVNAVFGAAEIRLNPLVPTRVNGSSAFGSVSMPEGSRTSFGSLTYTTKTYLEGKPAVVVKASTIFGGIEIRE
jgi:predicted membrane protein